VSRGVCAFTTKANNIQAAGGIAMILWNNQPGTHPHVDAGRHAAERVDPAGRRRPDPRGAGGERRRRHGPDFRDQGD
jgi:hypothetical protein